MTELDASNPPPSEKKPQDLTQDGLLAPAPRDPLGRPSLGGIPLTRKLGQGGMGAVYQGKHPRLGIEVAVKVLPFHLADQDPQAISYFEREARVAARLNHPNLVRVFDVNREGAIHFLVMEYVSGMTAGALLRERMKGGLGPLPESDALDLMIVVCDGLASAHDENMVHRDIKPDNIIVPLDENGLPQFKKAKLMDLGLAKDLHGGADLTGTNVAMGTPGYMSPEQAESARTATARADVFSMGATLYALLTGTAPFAGTTVLLVLRKTMEEPHKPVRLLNPSITERTAAVIDRCLAKAADGRFANARELAERLRECRGAPKEEFPKTVRAEDVKTASTIVVGPVAPRARKRSWIAVAAGLALLVPAGFGVWMWKIRPYRILMASAAECERREEWPEAVDLYERAAREFGREEASARLKAARAEMEREKLYVAAMTRAEQAEQSDDWEEAARQYSQAGEIRDKQEARTASARAEKCKQAMEQGRAALDAAKWEEAERAFQDVLDRKSDSKVAQRGLELAKSGRRTTVTREERLSEIRRTGERDPEAAWKLVRRAIRDSENDADLRLEACRIALQAKQEEWYGEAITDAEVAVALGAHEAEKLKRDLMDARRSAAAGKDGRLEDLEKAVQAEDFERALEIVEDVASSGRSRPLLKKRMEMLQQWLRTMAAAKEAEERQDWAEAAKAYERAAKIGGDPESEGARRGVRRVQEKRDKLFREILRRAEELAGQDPERAAAELAKARAIYPDHSEVKRLGDALAIKASQALEALRSGKRREALALARRIAGTDPTAPELDELERELWPELLESAAQSEDGPTDELLVRGGVLYSAGDQGLAAWDARELRSIARSRGAGSRAHSMVVLEGRKRLVALVGDPDSKRPCPLASYDLDRPGAPLYVEIEAYGMAHKVTASGLGRLPGGDGLVRVQFQRGEKSDVDRYVVDVIDAAGAKRMALDIARGQTHARIATSPDEGSFVTGGGTYDTYGPGGLEESGKIDSTVYLWFLEDRQFRKAAVGYPREAGEVRCLEYAPDGLRIFAGTAAGKLLIFDVAKRALEKAVDLEGPVTAVATDGVRAAVVVGGRLKIVSFATGTVVEAPGQGARSVEFSSDGGLLVGGERRIHRFEPRRLR